MRWEDRARRARFLAERHPASARILGFYAGLADWQAQVADRAGDLEALADDFPSLLDLVAENAPAPLARVSRDLDGADFTRLVRDYWEGPGDLGLLQFFARAVLQPHAAGYPAGLECPWCGQPPQVGVLRTQGDGLAVELVCGLCLRPRPHSRHGCPACGESAASRLASFGSSEFPHLRLRACDSCRGYLTLVDLSKDGKAIPEVDELAAAPLDLWALERGYRKLLPNIVGL